MKGKVIIHATDGLYFCYEDDSIYFVEKRYIGKFGNIVQLFMIAIVIVLSLFIPYFFKGSNIKGVALIILLTIAYIIYFYICIYLIVTSINNNYIKRYECYKYLISTQKKKALVSITKRAGIVYSILSLVFIIGAVWIYSLFLTKGNLNYLLESSFVLGGTFSLVLPFVINTIKIHIRLKKELTE